MDKKEVCDCNPCECDPVSPVSGGDACVCNPCECDLPKSKCDCDPCECETPPDSPKDPPGTPLCDAGDAPTGQGFTLNEFIRAKEYFLTTSTNTGLSIYEHVSDVLRKLLDHRAPPNSVDFLEEISLNMKRYKFGMGKDLLRDSFFISPQRLEDSLMFSNTFKEHAHWSAINSAEKEEDATYGGFPNLMRLLYYLQQVNVGIPSEEMYRVALAIRQLNITHPVIRSRFWGKVFGTVKNYYVVEAELKELYEDDLWVPQLQSEESNSALVKKDEYSENNFISGAATYQKASGAVTDPSILVPYQETSGLPPSRLNCGTAIGLYSGGETEGEGGMESEELDPDAVAEAKLWTEYQNELMVGFPIPPPDIPEVIVPPEDNGTGVNRRSFFVCNELGEKWILLPIVTPAQIQVSRRIRWHLTGNLNTKIEPYPEFEGLEGHYLKTVLARITAGAQVSPKGYFTKTNSKDFDEEEEEEVEEEEEDESGQGTDLLYPKRKFRPPPMEELLNLNSEEGWIHHVSYIFMQGRTSWWNPVNKSKYYDEEEELGEEEEIEEETKNPVKREFGPKLFSPISADKTFGGFAPWSLRPSTSVFNEFRVVAARSNIWPGATAMCTSKGKVENIYFGDGLKFEGSSYVKELPENIQTEYKEGPELTETTDPTVQEEKDWLEKIQLAGLNDIEEKFVDNEETTEGEEDEEDELTDEED